MKGRDSGTLPPQLSTPSTCVSGSVRSCFPFIFGSNSSSKVANYQRYLIPAILTIYSHDYPRENLLLSGKGTFSCMAFTFAPLVGVVSFFRAGKVCFVFLCSEKNRLWKPSECGNAPLRSQITNNIICDLLRVF